MKKTLSNVKKLADTDFSKYIRLRDCYRTTKTPDRGKCITCGESKPYNQLHAGHFQSRRHLATRYDEQNVHAQCAACNTFRAGEQYKYAKAIDKLYGEGTAEQLEQKANTTIRMTPDELSEMRDKWKEKLNELIRSMP